MLKVGFIGLGNIGGKLAGSLLRNGVDLTVRDLNADIAQPFLDAGAKWACSGRTNTLTLPGFTSPSGKDALNLAPEANDIAPTSPVTFSSVASRKLLSPIKLATKRSDG